MVRVCVRALAVWLSIFAAGLVGPVWAQNFQPIGFPPGATASVDHGISGDGSTLFGNNFDESIAFRWDAATSHFTLLGGGGEALGSNADGSVIVGDSPGSPIPRPLPVYWTAANSWAASPIPLLSGENSGRAWGASATGTIIVGDQSGGANEEAFVWTSAGGTLALPRGLFHDASAQAISSDGSTIVGQAYSTSTAFGAPSQPFYWRDGMAGITGLGDLPGGTTGLAHGVNSDGTVIVGSSASANAGAGEQEAFRWVEGVGIEGLGDLGDPLTDDFDSTANAVSADGEVVVGRGTLGPDQQAFRWTEADGMVSIADTLAGLGVDLTDWNLISAQGISADGTTIAGFGTDPSSAFETWLAVIPRSSGGGGGLIGIDDFLASLAPVDMALNSGAALTSGSAATAAEVARDYGCGDDNSTCVYGVGGSQVGPAGMLLDPDFGLIHGFGGGLKAGLGLSLSTGGANPAGGSEHAAFAGLQGFMAYDPEGDGLRIDAAFSAGVLGVDTTRAYLNGATLETATGTTSGDGESGSIRFGWQVLMSDTVSFTPFAAYSVTHIALAGYTETSTGPFPATFSARSTTRHDVSIGTEAKIDLDRQTTLTASLAWQHVLAAGADPLAATVPGVLTAALPGATGSDEFDLGVAVVHALSAQATIGASMTATLSSTGFAAGTQAGFSYRF